jgi:hypothetical protein
MAVPQRKSDMSSKRIKKKRMKIFVKCDNVRELFRAAVKEKTCPEAGS